MRALVVVTLLASGCDALFGFDPVVPVAAPDAPPGCGAPDEDGDCIADDVDNCPGISNRSQANDLETGMQDMVGDVCDPEPTQGTDARKGFFGFNDPAQDTADWRSLDPGSTMWMHVTGAFDHPSNTEGLAILQRQTADDDDQLAVEAGFTFASWGGTDNNSRVGVFLDQAVQDSAHGEECWASPYDTMADGHQSLYLEDDVGYTTATPIPILQPGDDVVITLLRKRGATASLECRALVNGVAYAVRGFTGTAAAGGHIAMQAQKAAATLRYVVTYVAK